MPTITLRPTGAAFNSAIDANVTVVGSSPQWADSSDSSYATGDSNATNSRANMAAPLEPLVLPAGATVTGIRATVRLSASGGTEAQTFLMFGPSSFIPNQFACYFTSDTSDLSDNGTYGLTGTPADIDVVVATAAGVSADPLTTLQGTPYVGVATSGLEAVTVYEFTVFVDYTGSAPTFAPPQRLTNRDDMFGSARRVTGSTSRQGSNRLTGYL